MVSSLVVLLRVSHSVRESVVVGDVVEGVSLVPPPGHEGHPHVIHSRDEHDRTWTTTKKKTNSIENNSLFSEFNCNKKYKIDYVAVSYY